VKRLKLKVKRLKTELEMPVKNFYHDTLKKKPLRRKRINS